MDSCHLSTKTKFQHHRILHVTDTIMQYSRFTILLGVILLLTFSIITISPLYAQKKQSLTIKGRVINQQTNKPLAGANIYEPDAEIGAVTNKKGRFKIKVPKSATRLRISYIGFKTRILNLHGTNQYLKISLKPQSVVLNEINVVASGYKKKPQGTTGSVGLVTSDELERTNQVSLAPALNMVSGVRMDKSNMEDSRISIRGVGIRSPWGIRNVKIYMNGIPLTQPNGVTRIEALDVSTVGNIEVFKGPAPVYGGSTAGVINIQLRKAPYGKSSVSLNALGGSYGLGRQAATYLSGAKKYNAYVTIGRQIIDGYRQHSRDLRRFLSASMQFYPSHKQEITLLISQSRQEAEIPGDLTAKQVEQNPQQANEANAAAKAGRYQTWTRIGASHFYDFSDRFSNQTSVYTYFFDLKHPLSFAYIMQPYQSYGGRTRFKLDENIGKTNLGLSFGGEYQRAIAKSHRFVENGGEPGDLLLLQNIDNTQYYIFLKAKAKLVHHTTLEGSVSLKNLQYDITDFLHHDDSGVKKFGPVLLPRIAVSHVFNKHFALRADISYGYSPPTNFQIQDAEGKIQQDIEAVKGMDYEVGTGGSFWNGAFRYDLTLFSFQARDQLIPQTLGPGHTIYVNAGRTSRLGIETALSYLWTTKSAFINSIRPFVNYTYSNFTFKEFQDLGPQGQVIEDYSGNKETGISPHHLSAGLNVTTRPGFYLNTSYYFNGREPITDANTVYLDAYSLLNAQIGYKAKLGNHFKIKVKAGIKNMLNAQYSPFTALNASSQNGHPPAFYNPAPDRNYYAGMNLTYFIK